MARPRASSNRARSYLRYIYSRKPHNKIYKPLEGDQTIRLMRLHAGPYHDDITIDLAEVELGSAQGTYDAVSYCWGNPRNRQSITCNGFRLQITANAAACLRRLRKEDESCLLWMDAICINQDDVQERGSQVKIMHLMYKYADRVHAWLGDEADDGAIAMDFAASLDTSSLLKEWQLHARTYRETDVFQYSREWICDVCLRDEARQKRIVRAVLFLATRPWMTRVWIQQEIAFAQRPLIHCGSSTISWDHYICMMWICERPYNRDWPQYVSNSGHVDPSLSELRYAIDAARSVQCLRDKSFSTHRQVRPDGSERGPVDQFIDKLYSSWTCRATDDRDKIYALLNLAPDVAQSMIDPDYTVPWDVVYTKLSALVYTQTDDGLMLLRCAGSGAPNFSHGPKHRNLPSWVVDWRQKCPDYFNIVRFRAGTGHLCIDLPRPEINRAVKNVRRATLHDAFKRRTQTNTPGRDAVLKVHALMMDRIAFVADSPQSPFDETDYDLDPASIRAIDDEATKYLSMLDSTYLDGKPAIECYKRTMIANTNVTSEPSLDFCHAGYAQWREWVDRGAPTPSPQYYDAMIEVGFGWYNTFAVTDAGYFCLVSRSTAVDDHVAIIAGSAFPLTLRACRHRQQRDKAYYSLVQACYIHGMVDGEVWPLLDRASKKQASGAAEREDPKSLGTSETADAPHTNYDRVMHIIGVQEVALV